MEEIELHKCQHVTLYFRDAQDVAIAFVAWYGHMKEGAFYPELKCACTIILQANLSLDSEAHL